MLEFSVTFFFTFLNIGILFLILRLILFKPVTKFMKSRTLKIQNDIAEAEREKTQAKAMRQNYEERLRNIHAEAEAIIRDAREAAQQQAERIIAGGRTEAWNLLMNARKQIETEERAAFAVFQAEAGALVLTATGRLLGREITAEDSLRQAKALLRELGKKV
jgi:F-type H+-transporting ATPase subunit b